MNWGKSIVVVFVVFAGFIGSLVYRMSHQRVDLVRDDYYQTEMAYQQHIDRLNRTARLENPIELRYQPDLQRIEVELPDSFRTGEISFYRPSDRRQDTFVRLAPNHRSVQTVSTANLSKGYWKVQFSWSDGKEDYFTEKPITIN